MKKTLGSIILLLTGLNVFGQTPAGLTKTTVLSGLEYPVHFDMSSDQRYFITQKGGNATGSCANGKILVYSNTGTLLSTFYDLTDSVQCEFERGLLGITLDPGFITNHYVYAYYNHKFGGDERIRVVRFTENNNLGTNPFIVLDIDVAENIPGNHVGGMIEFNPTEPDKIYVGIGDLAKGQSLAADTSTNYADTRNTPFGKILRINTDGSIPNDNPFYDDGNPATGDDDRIFTFGHRNMFGFCFNPANGQMYSSENGYNKWDELNVINGGDNYGWITCEGNYTYNSTTTPCSNPAFHNPIAEWAAPLPAVTGCLFYSSTTIPSMTNHMIVADNDYGRLYDITLGNAPAYDVATGNTQWGDITAAGEGGLTTLKQGPEGCIYAMNGGYTTNGKIYKLCPTGMGMEEIKLNNNLIGQNYPNPSNGSINIDFEVEENSDVKVELKDQSGRVIAVLYNNTGVSGKQTICYNAGNEIASGVYFYTFEVTKGGMTIHSEMKKMTVIK